MFLMTFADKNTVILCDEICKRMMLDACDQAETTTDKVVAVEHVELANASCHVCWQECGTPVAA